MGTDNLSVPVICKKAGIILYRTIQDNSAFLCEVGNVFRNYYTFVGGSKNRANLVNFEEFFTICWREVIYNLYCGLGVFSRVLFVAKHDNYHFFKGKTRLGAVYMRRVSFTWMLSSILVTPRLSME